MTAISGGKGIATMSTKRYLVAIASKAKLMGTRYIVAMGVTSSVGTVFGSAGSVRDFVGARSSMGICAPSNHLICGKRKQGVPTLRKLFVVRVPKGGMEVMLWVHFLPLW